MSDKRPSAELRQQVVERARCCCEECRSQAHYEAQTFLAEHIIPGTKGATVLANLTLAC